MRIGKIRFFNKWQFKSLFILTLLIAITLVYLILADTFFLPSIETGCPINTYLCGHSIFIPLISVCNGTGFYVQIGLNYAPLNSDSSNITLLNATMVNGSGMAELLSCGNPTGTGACKATMPNNTIFVRGIKVFNFSQAGIAMCPSNTPYHAGLKIWYSYKSANKTVINSSVINEISGRISIC